MSIEIESRPQPSSGTSPRPSRAASSVPAPALPEAPRLPGRRNPRWIALGVIALCLGGLLSFVLYTSAASQTAVVGVARTVYRGQLVQADDLTTITLRGGSIADAVPAAELTSLVGRRAAFDLPEGGVVTRRAVATLILPAPARAVIGLKLASGRAPGTLLEPGSPVRLVALPPPSGAATTDKLAGKTYSAEVVDQTAGADGDSVLLDVQVDAQQAPTVATLAAADRLAVVRDAGR